MKTLAFTICSINYLAQARTLGESLAVTNPDIHYVIGLVDRLEGVAFESDKIPSFELLELHRIHIPNREWMEKNYDITELNTAVKPLFFQHFYKQYPDYQNFIYFDPDIIVFTRLTYLLDRLQEHQFVLTPHTLSPFPDTCMPNECDLLNTGTFNLGFIALRKTDQTQQFINWWAEKLAYQAYNDICNGLFTDQKWINYVPHYFDGVYISRHPGHNVAYWNLHERQFTYRDGQWLINDNWPLQFFHFSGYSPTSPDSISRYQNRFTFEDRPDVRPLFDYYAERMNANFNAYYRLFPCVYVRPKKLIRLLRVRKALRMPFEKVAHWLNPQA
ncbi:glycosyl transferase [Siphonobacter curvatus]|uniref:Glycosyl transferase n=1 Tax=Siphonobacter curvatus TaxID=2094562 RepID=A0A2S7IQY7_9BACT|nr:glycosyl transferase [Siphonobacter curvatus]PQA60086.1 glycosyl transferase [Siphonobacter curvatus]